MNLSRSTALVVASLVGTALFSVTGRAQTAAPTQPAIDGVIAAGTQVELVRDGFTGGEGPAAAPDGSLYFTDRVPSRIYKLDKNGTLAVWRENAGGASGLFLAK